MSYDPKDWEGEPMISEEIPPLDCGHELGSDWRGREGYGEWYVCPYAEGDKCEKRCSCADCTFVFNGEPTGDDPPRQFRENTTVAGRKAAAHGATATVPESESPKGETTYV